jgi:alkylation response protein AidB-like acyl-CoA dehydrogenase
VALSGAGGGLTNVGGSSVDRLVELARKSGDLEPVLRDEVTKRWIEGQAIRLTNERGRATRSEQPGPEGSVTKLFQGLYNRRLQETLLRVLGARSIGWNPADEEAAAAVFGFLRSQANTIEGGTSNIQRNVVGERVLGLPREPGPDRETPWAALPRNG